MKSVILQYLNGIVLAVIIYLWQRAIRQLRKQKKADEIITHGLLILLIGIALIPISYGLLSRITNVTLSNINIGIMIGSFIAQLITIVLLYFIVLRDMAQQRNQAIISRDRQYDEFIEAQKDLVSKYDNVIETQYDDKPMDVFVSGIHCSQRTITVHRLRGKALPPDRRLLLNAKTFYKGIGFLKKQIDNCSPAIEPQLCIGINSTGGAVASYFSRNIGHDRIHLGFVRTEGPNHEVTESLLPKIRNLRTILLADIEVKQGHSIRKVFDLLYKKYGANVHIHVAVLVASELSKNIKRIDDLLRKNKGNFDEDSRYLPNFLAFTSSNKVRIYGNIR